MRRRNVLIVLILAGCGGGSDPATPDAPIPGDAEVPLNWDDPCAALAATYAAPAVPGTPARTLYVDGSAGDDSRTGLSEAEAWRTLGKVNTEVQPGDLVLATGAFVDEQIAPRASGTETARVIYQAAPGRPAPSVTITTDLTAISLADRDYVVIDGFAIDQQAGGDVLYMIGADHDWLRNLVVRGGTARIWASADNRIEDSTFDATGDPLMYARDGDSRNVFARNAFRGAAIEWGMGDNGVAPSSDTVFFANDFVNHAGGSIALAGLVPGTQFLCNSVHESGIDRSPGMQGPDQPESGAGPALSLVASGQTIRFNLFHANKWEVIRMQARGDCTNAAGVMNVSDNLIQHNVFYGNGGPNIRMMNSGPGPSGCGGATPLWGDLTGNRIENNLYWKNSTFCDFHFCNVPNAVVYAMVVGFYHTEQDSWPNGAAGLNGNVISNNFIGRDVATAGTPWLFWEAYHSSGAREYTLAEAAAAFPGELDNNREDDPQLRAPDAGIFVPVDTSPAIDTGVVIDGLSYQGAAPDPGRYEYHP
jgi:hypothetical protein